jgi:abhydrolase domain-containing protein 12
LLHGNAGSRAAPFRIAHYSGFTSRIGANVLAIDYRGFGDSTGYPSEDGLARDAQAAWEWLLARGAKPQDILIVGHSMGTGVAARLASELGHEGVTPRGLVLLAPFSSIRTLLDTYVLLGIIPIGAPLSMIPGGSGALLASLNAHSHADNPKGFITWSLIHKFDTLSLMPVRRFLVA